ncbi:hypothetical protein [Nonomuraea sp. NPDC049625]|uniref:hypothetical protein n=1 Tax=Nonomuraea sp. NPDC049625 TaxID=3155775 RepID=UPI003428E942
MPRERRHARAGENGVEDTDVRGISIADEEAEGAEPLAEVHEQVSGLLGRPSAGRVRGHARDVHTPRRHLDEDQHIQPFEQYRLDHQEVTRDDRVRLGGQELPPAPKPQIGFSRAIRTISALTGRRVLGRPGRLLPVKVHYALRVHGADAGLSPG